MIINNVCNITLGTYTSYQQVMLFSLKITNFSLVELNP